MSIWKRWEAREADQTNLRLLIPEKGWIAFEDKLDGDGNVEEYGSRELVVSALTDAISSSHFLTLTGAGASFSARNEGDGVPQPPSIRDLWEAVKSSVGKERFDKVCSRFPNADIAENIEKLLSLCKIYLELNESAADDDEEVDLVRSFVRDAEQEILSKVDFVGPETDVTAHQTYIRKIGRRGFRKSRAKIFTTNYDLTLEEAAKRLRFVAIDGFSHTLDQTYDRQNFQLDLVRREGKTDGPDYIPNVFQLYKLHGSTDWRRVKGAVVRSRDNDIGVPVLIYPRSSKYQEAFDPPYLDMMSAFQAALSEPDTALVVAGFGFNDDHISRPILAALESNMQFRLIVCDPGFVQNELALFGEEMLGLEPEHSIEFGEPHKNESLAKIMELARRGDTRIHLLNGRFADLADAMPDLIGQTDRERHFDRVSALRGGNV